MGMSANQARFLSLTSRQVDLEYRMQQICHRRLRIASELEKIATTYNNALSDRKLFASNQKMYQPLSSFNLKSLGYKVIDNTTGELAGRLGVMNDMVPGTSTNTSYTAINSTDQFLDMINNGTFDYNGDYILNCDLDLEGQNVGKSVLDSTFTGNFDGNGYAINNMNLTTSDNDQNVGFFSTVDGANISNLVINDATITTGNDVDYVGAIAGKLDNSTITNSSVDNIQMTLGDDNDYTGGALGDVQDSTISNIAATGKITSGEGYSDSGGLIGAIGDSTVSQSACEVDIDINNGISAGGFIGKINYASQVDVSESYYNGTINIVGGHYSATDFENYAISGFIGNYDYNHTSSIVTVDNSYAQGAINMAPGTAARKVAGFAAVHYAGGNPANQITNSYAIMDMPDASMLYDGSPNAFVDSADLTVVNSFYNSDIESTNTAGSATALTTEEIASGASPIDSFSSSIWNTSSSTPTLNNVSIPSNVIDSSLEEGLRNGTYSLIREADNYTQNPIDINGTNYELTDWRTVPTIDDDLYKANDTEAETEYEAAIEKINSQDKKLQLEQSQIDVEHKAIVTQKDAVKNILNKNIESSFKTFS